MISLTNTLAMLAYKNCNALVAIAFVLCIIITDNDIITFYQCGSRPNSPAADRGLCPKPCDSFDETRQTLSTRLVQHPRLCVPLTPAHLHKRYEYANTAARLR